MYHQPVIIVHEGRSALSHGAAALPHPLSKIGILQAALGQALACGLPVVLAASAAVAEQSRHMMALRDIVVLNTNGLAHLAAGEQIDSGHAIAMAVGARPHAPGWVVLPGDMPLVRPDTILAVARGLGEHMAAYAQHGGRIGQPMGFASELFSELLALRGWGAARRMLARYPAHGVEVNDPGVLMGLDSDDELELVQQSKGFPLNWRIPRTE